MGKLAKNCLSEQRFWEIINASNGEAEGLKEQLRKLSYEEFFGYKYWWDYFHSTSYKQDLWAAAYAAMGGCSDDGFDYFRYWLVSRGKAIFFAAFENVDSINDELLKTDYPEKEDFAYEFFNVFEDMFNKEFDSVEAEFDFEDVHKFPELNFEWSEDDTESIKKICPKIFDQWWDNP